MSRKQDDWDIEWLLSLDRQRVGIENGYWWTVRVSKVEPSQERPHGLKYSITLHDSHDDRVLGFDNSHPIDVASGPARKSKRRTEYDHKDVRGKDSESYEFTSPERLIEDFFAEANAYLEKEGL